MTDDMGINPAITPASDVLVISHPYLPEGSLLLIDRRAMIREVFRSPIADLSDAIGGNYATSERQLDVFRSALIAPLHDFYAMGVDYACSEAVKRTRVIRCIQCGKRRHASRRRCVKCKRRSR